MKKRDLLADSDFLASANHFARACAASRAHQDLAIRSCEAYGNHGAPISGCVRDHFPIEVKNRLRGLARRVTNETSAAWGARPPRVRASTMRRLASAIARRDGSGFYGPQP